MFYQKQDEQIIQNSEPKSITSNSQNTEVNTSVVSTKKEVVAEVEPPRRVAKPLKSNRKSAFSLSIDLDEKSEEVNESIENYDHLPKDSFDVKKLEMYWSQFLEQLKDEKQIPSYNALETARIILKNESLVQVELASISSQDEFEGFRDRIVNGLKTFLNNFSIKIETIVTESVNTTKFRLSTKDIAQNMAAKNPSFLKLLDEFGLNIYD